MKGGEWDHAVTRGRKRYGWGSRRSRKLVLRCAVGSHVKDRGYLLQCEDSVWILLITSRGNVGFGGEKITWAHEGISSSSSSSGGSDSSSSGGEIRNNRMMVSYLFPGQQRCLDFLIREGKILLCNLILWVW